RQLPGPSLRRPRMPSPARPWRRSVPPPTQPTGRHTSARPGRDDRPRRSWFPPTGWLPYGVGRQPSRPDSRLDAPGIVAAFGPVACHDEAPEAGVAGSDPESARTGEGLDVPVGRVDVGPQVLGSQAVGADPRLVVPQLVPPESTICDSPGPQGGDVVVEESGHRLPHRRRGGPRADVGHRAAEVGEAAGRVDRWPLLDGEEV